MKPKKRCTECNGEKAILIKTNNIGRNNAYYVPCSKCVKQNNGTTTTRSRRFYPFKKR